MPNHFLRRVVAAAVYGANSNKSSELDAVIKGLDFLLLDTALVSPKLLPDLAVSGVVTSDNRLVSELRF